MATAGQKRAHGQSPDWADEVVEKGDIFFAYRPRIGEGEVEGLGTSSGFFHGIEPGGRQALPADGARPQTSAAARAPRAYLGFR